MNTFSLDSALNIFGEVTETPTDFLDVNKQIIHNIKLNMKEIYDFTKNEEMQSTRKNSLSKLFVKDLDSEQIWQQLEIQNENVVSTLISNISVLLVDKDNLRFKNVENESKSNCDIDSDSGLENADDFKNDSQHSEGSSENGSESGEINNFTNDTAKNYTEESSSDDQKYSNQKKQANNSVEDEFFKLSEMENFLNAQEKKITNTGDDDYSDSDESEKEGSIDLFKENETSLEPSLEQEDESKTARFKDYFVAKDETRQKQKANKLFEELNDEEEFSNEIKSSLNLRQELLQKKIKRLEEKAVSEKPWQLKGEVTAENRPQNSLLAEVVGFDLTSRPAPVISEQTSLQLEDIIKQRIKDKVFDSVERKNKPIETPFEYRKKVVLDQEKSKQSLTQIYEGEYFKQQANLDPTSSEQPEQEPELHNEVKVLMKNLFTKLDALSNFYFTSKPTVPELKITSHLPAINIEEVAPVAATDASLLAPEEIKNKQKKLNKKSSKKFKKKHISGK